MPDDTRETSAMPPAVDRWLRAAVDDAERRGLPELKALLEGLAAATVTLRAADWNDQAPTLPQAEVGGAQGGSAEPDETGSRR